jgi:putative ABC transport system permease protein
VSGKIIGKHIYIKRHKFSVIGVYEKNKYVTFADNPNESAFMHIQKAELVFGTRKISNFKAKIREGYPAEQAKRNIQDYFMNRNKLMVNVETQEMLIKQAEEQARTSSNVLIATAAISLIVGGIGIMNLMLISIKERRREIGIRRSCGAQKSHIAVQFLSEAVILSLIGGISGVIAGIVVSLIIAFFAKWNPIIPVSSIFLSFTVSLLTGVIFGYMPAKRAAAIEIIDALKME